MQHLKIDLVKYRVQIKGIVQGVGFRPFIYNLAVSMDLKGWVMNTSEGVSIETEGTRDNLELFVSRIQKEAPALAYIEECQVVLEKPTGYTRFIILESSSSSVHDAYISPDISVCPDCLRELGNPDDRRYQYPFINCTNCGPRFTITHGIPYDRVNTTMQAFEMCPECAAEYQNPADRRFHAQPVACPQCGPVVTLCGNDGAVLEKGNEISEAKRLLKEGKILAVKGLGGFHLACDATQAEVVEELRKRKVRDGKPFALMVKDFHQAELYCETSPKERELLESIQRPVVLLRRKNEQILPFQWISADNDYLGIMLPYTPLHYLLFDEELPVLVMTSGNKSGEPIYYKNEDAISGLKGIADYFLIHNREIYIRTDDSVTGVFREKEYIIRRSRGYVPFPIDLSWLAKTKEIDIQTILSCGGELKSTFCIVKKGKAFLGHHIGDLENLETLGSFEDGIEHFKKILAVQPGLIAYDSHPEYLSSKYADALHGLSKLQVQHHHAHIASCMAENRLEGSVIGIAFDGTGYGEDGCIWGGEFFTGDFCGFVREAYLDYVPMPGGEWCIKEPWRMAYSYLLKYFGDEAENLPLAFLNEISENRLKILKQQYEKGIYSPRTSSMGRLFDAVSAIIGLCSEITYEGEAAIRLEKEADIRVKEKYTYSITRSSSENPFIVDTGDLIREVVHDIIKMKSMPYIAGAFHNTVSAMALDICCRIRKDKGLNRVALSGGVFQNRLLLEGIVAGLEREGFEVYTHCRVPANDGGIALGQAAVALYRCTVE